MPVAALRPHSIDDEVRLIGGNLTGRYTLADRAGVKCFACRANSISARSMALSAPVKGAAGETIAIYFDDFGFLRGRIARLLEFGFTVDVLADDAERGKIAATIRWLKKRVTQATADQRQHKRVLPRSPRSSLVLADGTKIECFIIDMSPSGVAVSADVTPHVGQPLAVGRAVGRVVRHLDVGFAVQFVTVYEANELEHILDRLA